MGANHRLKFLRTNIDTHGKTESTKTDKFSGFKSKEIKNSCSENNKEQNFCPVGDHRGCGLVERMIQTIKRRLWEMLSNENQNMTPEKWEGLADQVLTRGVQKLVEKILTSQKDEAEDAPPGFLDNSGHEDGSTAVRSSARSTKNQRPNNTFGKANLL